MRKSTGRSCFRSPHEHLAWIVYRENDEVVAVFSNEVAVNAYIAQREEDLRVEYREVEVWLGPCAKCERCVGEHVFGDGCPFFEVSKTLYKKKRYSKPKVRPGTVGTAHADLGKAVEECKATIVHELRLDWLCEKLNDLILAAQKALADALAWDRDCKELGKTMEEAGVKPRSMPFNDYLYYFHGIGNQEKGDAK